MRAWLLRGRHSHVSVRRFAPPLLAVHERGHGCPLPHLILSLDLHTSQVLPPRLDALPYYYSSHTEDTHQIHSLAQRYLRTVRESVLHSLFQDDPLADFDHIQVTLSLHASISLSYPTELALIHRL